MKSEATIARIVLPLLAIALVGPALPWLRTPVLAQTPLSGDSGRIVLRTATLRYVVEGQGRPCIVYGVHLLYPRTFSQRFKSELRCVYLDNRASDPDAIVRPEAPYTIEASVEDLEAARQKLQMDRFVLIGHSVFGLTVLAYARRHPNHVSQVVAIGALPEASASFNRRREEFWNMYASTGRKAADEKNRASLTRDSLAKLTPSDAFIARYVAGAAHYWKDSTYDASPLWKGVLVNLPLVAQQFDTSRTFSIAADTAAVSVPVFVALGRYDFVVPYTTWEGFRGPFRDLTVRVFDGAGHYPQLEAAADFDRQLLAWLRR